VISTIVSILAQAATTAPANTPPVQRPLWAQLIENPLFFLVLLMLVFYVFVFRSKRKQDKERADMLARLKKNDRIQTIGGILGTVVEARDGDVLVKVDESANVKIRFARSAIHRVIEEGKSS
jgi:preprotein translocase subunit YajC